MSTPTPNRSNGRDSNGRFARGNPGGPGNPHAKRAGQLRSAVLNAVTEEDMNEIIRSLIEAAKAGDVQSAKVVLERTLGTPIAHDILERIEVLEESLATEAAR